MPVHPGKGQRLFWISQHVVELQQGIWPDPVREFLRGRPHNQTRKTCQDLGRVGFPPPWHPTD